MLADFILLNRDRIVDLTRARAASRGATPTAAKDVMTGIPLFLDQLVDALETARSSDVVDHGDIGRGAREHGHAMLRMGYSLGQVVHEYGDVCQVVTELAVQQQAPIAAAQFRTLNLCLDDAIAGAVTEYSRQREVMLADEGIARTGLFVAELHGLLDSATRSYELIREGQVAAGGTTGMILGRSLLALRSIVNHALSRWGSGPPP